MGKPGAKRNETARRAILDATLSIMQEDGFDGLTIEGVAVRAGVGKTTVYRWWSSKGALAVEAFLNAVGPLIAFADTGSPRDDIVEQMRSLAALYRGPTGRLVGEIVGAGQYDPAVREAFVNGFLEARREQAREVFRRGVEAGHYITDIDPDLAIDALYAPIYYRLLVSGGPIDDGFVTNHADLVLRCLTR